ncbi:phosphonate metabolism protein/1,5-bisphosphokinase (PRPP-forming) PhnN, partial [Clavibacter michiganensis subsp. michiganensis]|nr:phosphonate metabolism protein/1,5-bisphosphokinase (PRPP-forming) PhnN [Clavibacter michiganensis subsp. michiganensis]
MSDAVSAGTSPAAASPAAPAPVPLGPGPFVAVVGASGVGKDALL